MFRYSDDIIGRMPFERNYRSRFSRLAAFLTSQTNIWFEFCCVLENNVDVNGLTQYVPTEKAKNPMKKAMIAMTTEIPT